MTLVVLEPGDGSGSVALGDAWLRAVLQPVLSSPWFAANGTVTVTMDENDAVTRRPADRWRWW